MKSESIGPNGEVFEPVQLGASEFPKFINPDGAYLQRPPPTAPARARVKPNARVSQNSVVTGDRYASQPKASKRSSMMNKTT